MQNKKLLIKYTNSFIDELTPYLKKGFQVYATIHPAKGEGAVIEIEIEKGKRSEITFLSVISRVNDTLEKIDQKLIGGNIQGVTFRGTNLYMEGQRIVILKGQDEHSFWNNNAAREDVKNVVSPNRGAK